MELYKIRYNLYDYLVENNSIFEYTYNDINTYKYFLICIFIIFDLIIIINYKNITFISISFLIIGSILIYYLLLFDKKINNILEDEDFKNYINLFKLFNKIFIESYNINNISTSIKSIDNSNIKSLNDIIKYYQQLYQNYNNNSL